MATKIPAIKNTVTLNRPRFNFKSIASQVDQYKSIVRRRVLQKDPLLSNKRLDTLPLIFERYNFLNDNKRTLLEFRNCLQKLVKNRKLEEAVLNSLDLESLEHVPLLKDIKEQLKRLDNAIVPLEQELYKVCDALPNFIDESVHDTDIQVVDYINFPEDAPVSQTENLNAKTLYLQQNLKPQSGFDHKVIGESLNILEFTQAAKVSGNSWYYLLNDGALLEQALIQYTLKQARKAGFKMCTPPSIVKDEVSRACGFKPRDQFNEQQTYEINNCNLVLTGTAEIPLAGLSMNKLFFHAELPKNLVGISRSYRAEAGARGKDTKGLYRVHEFTKVELFTWCDQESSKAEFQKILNFQKSVIQSLGLFARVINLPANDLGAPAYMKYDIEAWMPGRGNWGELTSTSICTDFQSRRFHTKYVDSDNSQKFVHTLNGTALAVPRVIVALIENNYNPITKTIAIPKVLQPYMDDKSEISL